MAVPLNTLLGVALIAWLWLPNFAHGSTTQQWASALIFSVALLLSVLAHELAHAWSARRFGFPVVGITLWAFGGYTSYRPVRNTPGREAWIAFSGPAATFLVAAGAWLLLHALPAGQPMVHDILAAIATANLFVGVFNLLPGLPLDGGSILASGVWAASKSRSTGQRVAAYAGMILAALLVAVPLLLAWRSGGSVTLSFLAVTVLLAGFLFVGARSALSSADVDEALDGRTAADLAVPVVVVPESATVESLDQYLASMGGRPVVALVGGPDSSLRGYVLPPAMAAVPAPARSTTPISAVVRTVPMWRWLPADTPAAQAVEALRGDESPIVLLDDAKRPVALLIRPGD